MKLTVRREKFLIGSEPCLVLEVDNECAVNDCRRGAAKIILKNGYYQYCVVGRTGLTTSFKESLKDVVEEVASLINGRAKSLEDKMKGKCSIRRDGKFFTVVGEDGEVCFKSLNFEEAQLYFMKFKGRKVSSEDYEYEGNCEESGVRSEVEAYNKLYDELKGRVW